MKKKYVKPFKYIVTPELYEGAEDPVYNVTREPIAEQLLSSYSPKSVGSFKTARIAESVAIDQYSNDYDCWIRAEEYKGFKKKSPAYDIEWEPNTLD